MYKNVQKMYKISRKNIKRFGYICKIQQKGLKVLYVLILGEFGIIRNPPPKAGRPKGRYCNRDH